MRWVIVASPAYVKSDDIERLVQQAFGFWHFHSERTPVSPISRQPKMPKTSSRIWSVGSMPWRKMAHG